MAGLSEFQKAFAAARDKGETVFDFRGKKYNTKLADETPAKKATPSPSVPGRPRGGDASEQVPDLSTEPVRKTKLPAGSLLGRIARSQGAVSEGPEEQSMSPTDFSSAGRLAEEEARRERVGQKVGRVLGPQSMREESYKKGGKVGSASKRADGIASRGKTRGRMV